MKSNTSRFFKIGAVAVSALSLGVFIGGCSKNTASIAATPAASQEVATQEVENREPVAVNAPVATSAKPETKTAATKSASPKASQVAWKSDWEAAFKEAKTRQKPVMVDFYADWCGACKHLDMNIYSAPAVIQESKNFVTLKINTDKQPDLGQKYSVMSLPTIMFFDANGQVLLRQEGAPQQPDLFLEWMADAKSKAQGTPA